MTSMPILLQTIGLVFEENPFATLFRDWVLNNIEIYGFLKLSRTQITVRWGGVDALL
tara:strand:- start:262 stop:432 length:171 start_codon:yes stop_codon:yes gene_type:complete